MRNYSFDTLKLICAILVIIAHTKQPEYISKFTAPLIYCAVQTFFVISGYFTYGKINLYNIIHKRIISTTKLFIWSFLLYFLCFILVNGQDSLQHINLLFTYKFLIFNTVPYGMHLWYIAAYIYILIIKCHEITPIKYLIIPKNHADTTPYKITEPANLNTLEPTP